MNLLDIPKNASFCIFFFQDISDNAIKIRIEMIGNIFSIGKNVSFIDGTFTSSFKGCVSSFSRLGQSASPWGYDKCSSTSKDARGQQRSVS